MKKTGISGGLININSFITQNDILEIKNNIRTASISLAAKDGLTSLYADVEDALEKYKNTDVFKIMNELRGEKLLWVRARSIDADVVNANGDYFSKEELLKEVETVQEDKNGKKKNVKIPAYKTFEGVPIYANHKNDDVLEAKGMVVHAEWDEEENCVYTVFYIDETVYADIARGIRVGYMHDVSMGCQVASGECSECGNIAELEKDYCECLKEYKGKTHPKSHKKVYEKNMGLKFIELSVVGDGAFDSCEIEEIYDPDEILNKVNTLEKKALTIRSNVMVAATNSPKEKNEEFFVYEKFLRDVSNTTNTILRVAQSLVGVPASSGDDQNATVSKILQFLGIDPSAGLQIIDMLNLALNFLETAVINMFAQKDNVDLLHVSKISKAMADLQATMEDLIDDGIDSGSSGMQPLNQQSLQQGDNPGIGSQPSNSDYIPAGGVGQAMTQNQNFILPDDMGFEHQLAAYSKNGRIILWDSIGDENNSFSKKVSASNKLNKQTRVERFCTAFLNFTELADVKKDDKQNIVNKSINNKKSNQLLGGNKLMTIFERHAQSRRLRQAAKATEKFELVDKMQNKIVLSSNGDIEAYHKDVRYEWDPQLNDNHLNELANGNGIDVASSLLQDFAKVVSESRSNRVSLAEWTPNHSDEVKEIQLESKRTKYPDENKEELLGSDFAKEYKRQNPSGVEIKEDQLQDLEKNGLDLWETSKEDALGEDAGLYSRNFTDDDVKEHLLHDARLGYPDEVIEKQLSHVREDYGPGTPNLVVKSAIDALARSAIASQVTPDEIMEYVVKMASMRNLAQLIKLANLGSKHRQVLASRNDFYGKHKLKLSPVAAILDELGKEVNDEIKSVDLADVIVTAKSEVNKTVKSITAAAKKIIPIDIQINSRKSDNTLSKKDLYKAAISVYSDESNGASFDKKHLKTALSALAIAAEDSLVTPYEVLKSVNNINDEDLLYKAELATTDSAVEERLALRARKDFYGHNKFASKNDIQDNVVGYIADYAIHTEQPVKLIVEAAKLLAQTPSAAEKLIKELIASNNQRTSSINLTDEKSSTKIIECTLSDLGDLDPKTDDFENRLKDKAIQILSEHGHQIDPATFALSNVTVNSSGNVIASVTSRFSKTFNMDKLGNDEITHPELNNYNVDYTALDGGADYNKTSDHPLDQMNTNMSNAEQSAAPPETFASTSAKRLRLAQRNALLKKYAQMAPPGANAPGGAGTPAAGGANTNNMQFGGGDDLGGGLSSLTGGGDTGDEDPSLGDDQDLDSTSEPGTKKPLGSICPQCGSTNVDLADGQGHCNSCGADMTISYNIEVKPGNLKESDSLDDGSEDMDDMDSTGADADMGLGAATAPGGAPPAGGAGTPPVPPTPPPGMGGLGASMNIPIMVRISWYADPELHLQSSRKGFNLRTASKLPVGQICPSCGNRDTKSAGSNRHCYKCNEIYIPRIHASSRYPNKILVSVDKII